MKNTCVDICIATYKRPEFLHKLLLSILNQEQLASISIRVIVIDNDSGRSAEETVYSVLQSSEMAFVYDMQPEKNISLTRNMALDYVTAEYIAFVDDDEVVSNEWLFNLVLTAYTYEADVVFGPVIPVYPKDTPEWILKGRYFSRKRVAIGANISSGGTGNALVRRKEIIDKMQLRFDIDYGLTGGEDTHFFKRAKDAGATLIWCDRAEVSEIIPKNRLNATWLVQRAFRSGQAYSRIYNDQLSLGNKIMQLLLRTSYLGAALIALLFSLLLPKHITVHALRKVMSNAGQLSTFFSKNYYKEYAN